MKTVMITAPNSGSGKTTVTMGILRCLYNCGIEVCPFKAGPDYIDTSFLKRAAKKDAGNLDIHLEGMDGIKKALSMADGEYAVIEGAMGYFDGIYNTFENSSCDIAGQLGINSILVYTPVGEMFSAVPKIKGMVDFEGSTIKAVILNKVNEAYYKLLKQQIERYADVRVIGYLPCGDYELKSRHLGLIQCEEIEKIDDKIEKIASQVLKHVDMNMIMNLMKPVETCEIDYPQKSGLKVSIARDKAFSFYYRENIKLFEKTCNVSYFSPLSDKKIPESDILYIGGGYPEVFKHELSENSDILLSIRQYAQNGGTIYAECGGFMYLLNEIDGVSMCGILDGKSITMDKLQHFGYVDIVLKCSCLLGSCGDHLTGHEFHRSAAHVNLDAVYTVNKTMRKPSWNCGYKFKNVLGAYAHINFLGNMGAFDSLIKKAEYNKANGI